MTDPFNPDVQPAPEYEPGQGDPGPSEPIGPDIMPDPTPQEVPQMRGLKDEGYAEETTMFDERTGRGVLARDGVFPGFTPANPD